jgi:cytochrome P450
MTDVAQVPKDRIIDVDHHDVDFNLNEVDELRAIRERCPVAWNPQYGGFWMVTGYAEVARVAREEEYFSHRYEMGAPDGIDYHGEVGIPRPEGQPPLGIGEAVGTYHAGLRRALNPFLSPPAVERMRPFMEQAATWFLDQRIANGAMDLVHDYTNPIPAILTMQMMGLPYDDWRLYADLFHATMSCPLGSDEYANATAAVPRMLADLAAFAEERRRNPGDDLTSFLVQLEIDGAPLTQAQVLDILWNLIGGGVDTTTSLTSWSFWHMGRHPETRRPLVEHPELYTRAADEFLRYYSVNQQLSRTVTQDVELGGAQLCKGDRVLISWLAANHDPAEFERPDEIVVDRTPNRHLAFGLGPHRCIGSHLARVMFEVMVGEVLRRIPDYQIESGPPRQYLGSPTMTGLADLPITFTAGAVVGVERPY